MVNPPDLVYNDQPWNEALLNPSIGSVASVRIQTSYELNVDLYIIPSTIEIQDTLSVLLFTTTID